MPVGFRYKSDDYTAKMPCKFDERCSKNEVINWSSRARQWIYVAKTRVGDDSARKALVVSLVQRLIAADKMPRADTTLFGGEQNYQIVATYVGIAQQAEAAANQWGPPVKIGPESDGGEIAYDWGGFRPELPIPGGSDGQIPNLDPDKLHPPGKLPGIEDMLAGFGKWAPMLMALFVASQVVNIVSDVESMFKGDRRG